MNESQIVAKPKRLRSGDWGCVTEQAVKAGDEVTIHTARGKTWPAVVDKVIWTDSTSTWICATRSREDSDKANESTNRKPSKPTHEPAGNPRPPAPTAIQTGLIVPPAPPIDPSLDAMLDAESEAQAALEGENQQMMDSAYSWDAISGAEIR